MSYLSLTTLICTAIRDLKGDVRHKAYKLPLSEVDVKEMIGHAQLTELASGHQKSNPPGTGWNIAKVVLPKQLVMFEFAEVFESIRANLTPFSAKVTATYVTFPPPPPPQKKVK